MLLLLIIHKTKWHFFFMIHLKHIIKIGGEDVVAFGSDFDGIPAVEGLEGCEKMPSLTEYISDNLGESVARKLCFENFARVLKEVGL